MSRVIQGFLVIFLLAVSSVGYSAYSYYGPTFANEHLYRVALKVRPHPNVTVQQVMIAILFANPRAFTNNNINGMKSGYRLDIPPVEAIERIHPLYAKNAVDYQNSHWLRADKPKPSIQVHRHKHKQVATNKIVDEIPSIEKNSIEVKPESAATPSVAKTSITELANQQQGKLSNQSAETSLPQPNLNTALSEKMNDDSNQQLSTQINEKLNSIEANTQKFQTQTSTQIAALAQQNQALQNKVNQLNNELKTVTYRFLQLNSQNQHTKGQGAVLIENLRKNAIGLSSGILALILLTYLLARSFRARPAKALHAKEDMSITSKLDLARAYIDMGDNTSARSVLQEVMTQGNEEQRKGASDLLGKLNRAQ